MQNWAANYTFTAARIERPAAVADLAAIVRAADKVHAIGSRHCFNDIADTPGTLISTERLTGISPVDRATNTVTIEAGVTYGQLGPVLHASGYALPNLASLPHISVAGSVATATHGSGESLGNLATSVAGIDFILADGTIKSLKRGDADFDGAVVHLGRLGVVSRLTLDVVPTFDVAQFVYDRVPISAYVEHLDAIAGSVYSVSGFTDWQSDHFTQVWMKSVAGTPHFDLTTLGGTLATTARHPLDGRAGNVASEGAGAAACTQQLSVAGPWHERLPHFRLEFTPSSGEEIQSEFFVPREHVGPALAAVRGLHQILGPVLQVSEVRLVAADPLWMSMNYQRPSVGIHFTWHKNPAGVLAVLPLVEAALQPFDVRPHWGKVFTMPRAAEKYPKAGAFRSLVKTYDPTGKFSNAYAELVGI